MSDNQYIIQADVEFAKARRRSILSSLFSFAAGRSDELISLQEARDLLKPSAESFKGIQTIEIDKIVGSEGRYGDFNRRFLPRKSFTRRRWSSVHTAHQKDVGLPAIQVYELGGYYFIRDGNHRVSVGIQLGMKYIEAQVTALTTDIPVGEIETIEDLKRTVLDYEYSQFKESIGDLDFVTDGEIRFTATGRYDDLAIHIACHQKLHAGKGQQMEYREATRSWYRSVYLPIAQLIRDSQVLTYMPERTEADFYVWLIRNWDEISERYGTIYRPNRRLKRKLRTGS